MKIGLICTEKLPVPPILGGAIQIYIQGILPILAKKHDITMFSLQNDQLPDEEISNNIHWVRVQGRTKDEYTKNVKARLSNEFDLIHVFNRPIWINLFNQAAPNSAISLSVHNEMFAPKKIDPKRGQQCVERVSFISTVSKFIADGIKELYPSAEEKLNVVYSAVDGKKIKPHWDEDVLAERNRMRKEYGLDGYQVVLCVGRLSKKKGSHILLKAMEEVVKAHPKTALVFVGSKWYGSNTTDDYVRELQLMAANLNCPVVFTGFLPPAEIPKYYLLGDIFVCASQWLEPLARVHYEAMSAGLPIITTARGGNPEVIEELKNGLVINDYDNPQAMAEKIIFLIKNPDLALEMGKVGRSLAEEKFNWQRVADQLLNLFASV